MARIRKHRGKYQVLYRDPSTRRERSAGVHIRKSDALRKKREIELQLDRGEWVDPQLGKVSVEEWSIGWLKAQTHLKPKTVEGYGSLLNSHVLPRFGRWQLRSVRPIDVEAWVGEMKASGLSPSRIRQAVSVLNLIYASAERNLMLFRNPVRGVRLPQKPSREMLFLNPEEVGRLAHAVPNRYEALIYVLAYCGIRAGEATALRRHRVNLLRSELVVAESATEVHGELRFGETKNRSRRTVAVPQFLRDLLGHHLERFVDTAPQALVFTSPTGDPIRLTNFRNRVWRAAVKEAGLADGLRIHDLRHTAASVLISQNVHPRLVQDHLGHSSIAITMDRYGHLYPEDRLKVAEALDAIHKRTAL